MLLHPLPLSGMSISADHVTFFHTECLNAAERALALEADNVTALTYKGIALYELDRLDDAMESLNAAKAHAGGMSLYMYG